MMNNLLKLLFLAVGVLFFGCIRTEVKGIKLGNDLCDNQSYSDNLALVALVQNTLKKDDKSLDKLIEFKCGGAAGCYDLGEIIVQIIFKLGEDDFIEMASKLPELQKPALKELIAVGLDYGSFDNLKSVQSPTIEKVFPKLNVVLND